jgi:Uma2 family endonuclease
VKIYEQAGIAEYFLIKPRVKRGVPHYELRGYRLTEGVYQPILKLESGIYSVPGDGMNSGLQRQYTE